VAQDHFEKNSYQAGKVDWNFNIVMSGNKDLSHTMDEYAAALTDPGLHKPVPAEWLHVTILRVGFTSDFTEKEMKRVVVALRPRLSAIRAPMVALDGWWIWSGNVVTHVSPDDKLRPIYDAVIASMKEILGSDRTLESPHGRFLPHLTLAYSRTRDDELELHRRLETARITPVEFLVDRVSLVRQHVVDGHYEWDVVDEAPLDPAD
jgi:2'-5' RNA ligase